MANPPARVCTHPWEFAVEPFRIAGNLFYVGKVVYKEGRRGNVGEVYDGLHEPIVSESALRKRLSSVAPVPRSRIATAM